MKKILLAAALFTGSMICTSAGAQVRVSINANIGNQPLWGPAGYDYVQFYYLPDLDMYYDVQARQFVYPDRGRWVYTTALPVNCRNYDLYGGYKVVINDQRPFMRHDAYRNQYRRFKNYHNRQVIIRNNHDRRYAPYYNRHNDCGAVVIR